MYVGVLIKVLIIFLTTMACTEYSSSFQLGRNVIYILLHRRMDFLCLGEVVERATWLNVRKKLRLPLVSWIVMWRSSFRKKTKRIITDNFIRQHGPLKIYCPLWRCQQPPSLQQQIRVQGKSWWEQGKNDLPKELLLLCHFQVAFGKLQASRGACGSSAPAQLLNSCPRLEET